MVKRLDQFSIAVLTPDGCIVAYEAGKQITFRGKVALAMLTADAEKNHLELPQAWVAANLAQED